MSESKPLNFIEEIIENDLATAKHEQIITRFPPEPNGYLHIGHAKSICLNFGLAEKYKGKCNLRFDDTNPVKEDVEYVDSIREDIKWLGFQWEGEPHYASDYFDQLFEWAVLLIKEGKAYVDDQSAEDISATRGTPAEPGKESPYRNRSVEENLDLFMRMKNGEFNDGEKVLRAKTGMSSPNMHMRDPAIYRIKKTNHHRTGGKWCIYPMYDFAHGESDYIEGITHSLCTLEFEVHRPLYNWFLDQLIEGSYRPRQIEFARLNLSYTVMSKRKLLQLVNEGYVSGWDDPRMPTIAGLRRRGYTAGAIRNFADRIGIAKRDNLIDVALLEYSIREELNKTVPRVFAVLKPIKLIITNWPEGHFESMTLVNNPEDEEMGSRQVKFGRELWIEKTDFMIDPFKKYFRLAPGKEVRLKGGYIIKCEDYKVNDKGEVEAIYCSYDAETKSGSGSVKKVKGTIHWVSAAHAVDAEVRLYDRLFTTETPDATEEGKSFIDNLNPDSLEIVTAKVEPSLKNANSLDKFQFQRIGYFCVDPDSKPGKPVFNRTVPLRDSWSKARPKS